MVLSLFYAYITRGLSSTEQEKVELEIEEGQTVNPITNGMATATRTMLESSTCVLLLELMNFGSDVSTVCFQGGKKRSI